MSVMHNVVEVALHQHGRARVYHSIHNGHKLEITYNNNECYVLLLEDDLPTHMHADYTVFKRMRARRGAMSLFNNNQQ